MVMGGQAEKTEAGVTIHHGFGLSNISGFNAKLSSLISLAADARQSDQSGCDEQHGRGMGHGCCRRIVLNGRDIHHNEARRGA